MVSIDSMEIKDENKAYIQFNLSMKPFIEYIVNNLDKDLVILYPVKWDIEDYVFELESLVKKQYNKDIGNGKITYISCRDFLKESPTFLDYVVTDPRCYIKEIEELNETLDRVRKVLSGK